MVVISLVRGLGNQMFQYALYRYYQSKGERVFFKKSYTDEQVIAGNDNVIFDVFGIKENFLTNEEFENFVHPDGIIWKLERRILKKNHRVVYEKENGRFNNDYLRCKNVYLEGYWQTEKYFYDIRNEIIEIFTPVLIPNDDCKKMVGQIKEDNTSVSIHFRYGDYTSESNKRIYGNICTEEYYRTCMKSISSEVKDAHFYIFSNDIKQASILLGGDRDNITYMSCNSLGEGWADMLLMSLCRHNIIANSSFSWWGAYLNKNKDKRVYAPRKWKNTEQMPDICPDEWILV